MKSVLRLLKISSDLEKILGNEGVIVKTEKGLFVYMPPKENDTRDEK